MRTSRFLVLAIAATGGALLAPGAARAHDLNAKVDPSADPMRVVASFDDDTPAELAEVKVTDANGNEIAIGKTDERGVWTFPRPKPGEYTLAVKAFGHTATVPFSVSGDPESPTTYTGWRLNKRLGLAIGVVGLLGFSVAYWLFRRRSETR